MKPNHQDVFTSNPSESQMNWNLTKGIQSSPSIPGSCSVSCHPSPVLCAIPGLPWTSYYCVSGPIISNQGCEEKSRLELLGEDYHLKLCHYLDAPSGAMAPALLNIADLTLARNTGFALYISSETMGHTLRAEVCYLHPPQHWHLWQEADAHHSLHHRVAQGWPRIQAT